MSLSPHSSALVNQLDELDLSILLLLLQVLQDSLTVLRENLVAALHHIRKEDLRAKRAKPNVAPRKSFDEIAGVLSPVHFRRMFRMNRCSFDRLCDMAYLLLHRWRKFKMMYFFILFVRQ